jgi:hypothetical protein
MISRVHVALALSQASPDHGLGFLTVPIQLVLTSLLYHIILIFLLWRCTRCVHGMGSEVLEQEVGIACSVSLWSRQKASLQEEVERVAVRNVSRIFTRCLYRGRPRLCAVYVQSTTLSS